MGTWALTDYAGTTTVDLTGYWASPSGVDLEVASSVALERGVMLTDGDHMDTPAPITLDLVIRQTYEASWSNEAAFERLRDILRLIRDGAKIVYTDAAGNTLTRELNPGVVSYDAVDAEPAQSAIIKVRIKAVPTGPAWVDGSGGEHLWLW